MLYYIENMLKNEWNATQKIPEIIILRNMIYAELNDFVWICNLLMLRIIIEDNLNEAQERLKGMAYLIEHAYGPEFITSNIHLAFHISNCYCDYNSIYSF